MRKDKGDGCAEELRGGRADGLVTAEQRGFWWAVVFTVNGIIVLVPYRREDLLRMKNELDSQIDLLDQAVVEAAEKNEKAKLLMTQPGVGAITALAFVLTMGEVSRSRDESRWPVIWN